jgi:hypothetical protein
MPPVAAPTWWEDVQQEREDLAGRRRPVDEWLDEEVDFAPRKRLPRRSEQDAVVLELDLERRAPAHEDVDLDHPAARDDGDLAADDPLHGVFVHAESARGGGVPLAGAPARGTLDDARFLAPPPADGERRTVHITGRPEQARAPLPPRRHRPRTTADRVGPRPDRIALYAVVLGILLILIALSSASPS